MLSFFRKSKKRNPKKGMAFYHRENLIQTIDELNLTLSRIDSIDIINTDKQITFQDNRLDSITIKSLEDIFGEESYILEPESAIVGHKVYYYRLTAEHFRFLIQVHFINDEFFFIGNKIYTELPITINDKRKIIDQLTSKYIPDAKLNTIEFAIKDTDGNLVYTIDNIYYYLKYIANNTTSRRLKKEYAHYVKPEAGVEIKETLDKMI